MTDRFRSFWRNPAGRGFVLLALMQVAYGFAYSANNSTVTNFFDAVFGDLFGTDFFVNHG